MMLYSLETGRHILVFMVDARTPQVYPTDWELVDLPLICAASSTTLHNNSSF